MSKLIYKPSGKAGEYAPLACNVYTGCDHQCAYCYVRNMPTGGFGKLPEGQTRNGFIAKLRKEAAKDGPRDQVLLSFITDPYQPFDTGQRITRETIKILKENDWNVCTLTKGGSRALRDIDLFGPGDAFATTMTWLDDERSLQWEPGAALPIDRIETLYQFHVRGIDTWVSLEPVLSPEVALDIIRQTNPFVDLFKVGKLNYPGNLKDPAMRSQVDGIDWRQFALDVVELLKKLGKAYYIKEDLAKFAPGIDRGQMPVGELVRVDGPSQIAMF